MKKIFVLLSNLSKLAMAALLFCGAIAVKGQSCSNITISAECTKPKTCTAFGEITVTIGGTDAVHLDWNALQFRLTPSGGSPEMWLSWLGTGTTPGSTRTYPNAIPGNFTVEFRALCTAGNVTVERTTTVTVTTDIQPFAFYAMPIRKTLNCKPTGIIQLTFQGKKPVLVAISGAPAYTGTRNFSISSPTYDLKDLPAGTYTISAFDGCNTITRDIKVEALSSDVPEGLASALSRENVSDCSNLKAKKPEAGSDWNYYWVNSSQFYEYAYTLNDCNPPSSPSDWKPLKDGDGKGSNDYEVFNFPGVDYQNLCAGTICSWVRLKGCPTIKQTNHSLSNEICDLKANNFLGFDFVRLNGSCDPADARLQIIIDNTYGLCYPLTWELEAVNPYTYLDNGTYSPTTLQLSDVLVPHTRPISFIPGNDYKITITDDAGVVRSRTFTYPTVIPGDPKTYYNTYAFFIMGQECHCGLGIPGVETYPKPFNTNTKFTYVSSNTESGRNVDLPMGQVGASIEYVPGNGYTPRYYDLNSFYGTSHTPFNGNSINTVASKCNENGLFMNASGEHIPKVDLPLGYYTFEIQPPCETPQKFSGEATQTKIEEISHEITKTCEGYVVDITSSCYIYRYDTLSKSTTRTPNAQNRYFEIIDGPEGIPAIPNRTNFTYGNPLTQTFEFPLITPGTYTAQVFIANLSWGNSRCVMATYTFDIPASDLGFDYAVAYICPSAPTVGMVKIKANNGIPPYTYALLDEFNNPVGTQLTPGVFSVPNPVAGDKFYCEISDACNATPKKVAITMLDLKTVKLAFSNAPVCSDATLELWAYNLGDDADYMWTLPGGGNELGRNIYISPPSPGKYYLSISDHNGGCTYTLLDSVIVSVYPPVSAPASVASGKFCASGDLIEVEAISGITANAGHSLLWYSSNSPSATPLPPPVTITANEGNYSFWVAQATAQGCTSSKIKFEIDVTGKPAVISMNKSITCVNGDVTLYSEVNGEWSSDDPAVAPILSGIPTFTGGKYELTVQVIAPGSVTFTFTDDVYNCSTTSEILFVNAPTVTLNYGSVSFCQNESPKPVILFGAPGGTYSGTAGLAINATTGTIDPAASTVGTHTAYYTATYDPVCGSVTVTGQTSITISSAPNGTLSYSTNVFCNIDPATYSPTVSGSVTGAFNATPEGLSLNGFTGVITPSTSEPGVYTVMFIMQNASACEAVVTYEVVVVEPASPPVLPDQEFFCIDLGEQITIADLDAKMGLSGATWYEGGVTPKNPTDPLTDGYDYTAKIGVGTLCESPMSNPVTVFINLKPNPVIISNPDFAFCETWNCYPIDILTGINPDPGHELLWYEGDGLEWPLYYAPWVCLYDYPRPNYYVAQQLIVGGCASSPQKITITVNGSRPNAGFMEEYVCTGDFVSLLSEDEGVWNCSNPAVISMGTGIPTYNNTLGYYVLKVQALTSGIVGFTFTATGGCIFPVDRQLTVVSPSEMSLNYGKSSFCQYEEMAYLYEHLPLPGTFSSSPPGLVMDMWGRINLMTSKPGEYTVIYTISGGSCNGMTVKTDIEIVEGTATIDYGATYFCYSDPTTFFPTIKASGGYTITNITAYNWSGATLNIDLSTGAFCPGTSIPGSDASSYGDGFQICFEILFNSGCEMGLCTYVTLKSNQVQPFYGSELSFCGKNATVADLNIRLKEWWGYTGLSWYLDKQLPALSDIEPLIDGGQYFGKFAAETGCESEFSDYPVVVILMDTVLPTFSFPTKFCVGEPALNLNWEAEYSEEGVWGRWSPAIINTATATPPGTPNVYTFTPLRGECAKKTEVSVTIIDPNTEPEFDLPAAFCLGSEPVDLKMKLVSDNGIEGTWSPDEISTDAVGSSLYTFTPSSGECTGKTFEYRVEIRKEKPSVKPKKNCK